MWWEIFVCHYYEKEFKIEDVKTFWCEFAYLPMENPFLVTNSYKKAHEYIKLVELDLQVIGLLKDEWWIFTLTFMKNKLQNWLTMHVELIIQTFN